MKRRGTALLLVVASIGISCQAPTADTTPSSPKGRAVSLEHGAIADALRTLCPPMIDPLAREPWSREGMAIEIEYGLELSEWDIDQILKVAEQEGLAEPYRLVARDRMHPGSRSEVRVFAQPEEDADHKIRTNRWLTISCPDWLDGRRSPLPQGDPVDWVMARGIWSKVGGWEEDSISCFRNGDEVWTFRRSEQVAYETALSLLVSLAREEWVDETDWSVRQFESWQPQFKNGELGLVGAFKESRRLYVGVPEHKKRGWEFVLEVPAGPRMGVRYFLVRRDGDWVLVDTGGWIS